MPINIFGTIKKCTRFSSLSLSVELCILRKENPPLHSSTSWRDALPSFSWQYKLVPYSIGWHELDINFTKCGRLSAYSKSRSLFFSPGELNTLFHLRCSCVSSYPALEAIISVLWNQLLHTIRTSSSNWIRKMRHLRLPSICCDCNRNRCAHGIRVYRQGYRNTDSHKVVLIFNECFICESMWVRVFLSHQVQFTWTSFNERTFVHNFCISFGAFDY